MKASLSDAEKDSVSPPSSFIPFCSLGGNMSAVGSTVPNFPVPVCSSFKPYLLNSQVFCPHYIEGILIFELLLFRIVTSWISMKLLVGLTGRMLLIMD